MNREDIDIMWNKALQQAIKDGEEFTRYHFAALVRADERWQGQKWFDAVTAQHKQLILAEREACAKLVEEIEARCVAKDVDDPPLEHVAAAIRARGQA
jgi:hypothetical protein